jgi:hypothetical protein
MKTVDVPLYGGRGTTTVDTDFFETVLRGRSLWIDSGGYAKTAIEGNQNAAVHRLVINAKPGQIVDHIDRNRLNNTRANLRLVTTSQNNVNRAGVNNKTGFKGVSVGYRGKWNAYIKINGRPTYLGTFETSEGAARAYDKRARELHGAFAYQNFPQEKAA